MYILFVLINVRFRYYMTDFSYRWVAVFDFEVVKITLILTTTRVTLIIIKLRTKMRV